MKQYSFDEKCLDLARYFYPDEIDDNLRPLAQLLQDSVEEFSPLGPAQPPASVATTASPVVPPGHFWRGDVNRFFCRNCGGHYDAHLHTDEASRCPAVETRGSR